MLVSTPESPEITMLIRIRSSRNIGKSAASQKTILDRKNRNEQITMFS